MNQVFLNDKNIIEVIYAGDQTYESVKSVTEQVVGFSKKLKTEGKKVFILNALMDLGKTSAGSRRAAAEALRLKVYDRVALYGANVFFKYLANMIVVATGKKNVVKYFNTRQQGEQWLLQTEKKNKNEEAQTK